MKVFTGGISLQGLVHKPHLRTFLFSELHFQLKFWLLNQCWWSNYSNVFITIHYSLTNEIKTTWERTVTEISTRTFLRPLVFSRVPICIAVDTDWHNQPHIFLSLSVNVWNTPRGNMPKMYDMVRATHLVVGPSL